MNNKQHQFKVLDQWISTFQAHCTAQIGLSQERLGKPHLDALTKLTGEQLQAIVGLIAVSNAYGHQTCRNTFREMREDRYNKPVFGRRHAFKVIQGGAA